MRIEQQKHMVLLPVFFFFFNFNYAIITFLRFSTCTAMRPQSFDPNGRHGIV